MPDLLALSSSLMWGTADFMGGTISRRLPAVVVVTLSQTFALLAFLVAALAFSDVSQIGIVMPAAAGAGLAGAVGLLAFYAALASGTMGVVAPLAALGVLVPVVVGFVDGERPAAWQLVGAGLAVLGTVLSSGPELRGTGNRRALGLASIAAVGFGLTMVFLAEGGEEDPLLSMLGMRMVSVPMLSAVLLVLLLLGRSRTSVRGRDLGPLAAVGLLDGSANLAYATAIAAGGLLSLVSVLGSLYPAVTVVLARALHQERMTRVQDLGVILAITGVLFVAGGS